MPSLLLLILIITSTAGAAEVAGPSKFYVVSQFFSDNAGLFYYRVIDVKPEGNGSLVRYIRVAPVDVYCPRMVIQAKTATLADKRPAEVVKGINPCAVGAADLASAVRKYKRTNGALETISFGIVAQCGFSPVTLSLPIAERVDLEKMKGDRPEIARLWNLVSRLTHPAFGEKDLFNDRNEEEDLALQRAGEAVLPELTSGAFDQGLAAAVKGNVGTGHSPSFRALLANYQGPTSTSEAKASYIPQLVNPGAYLFADYTAPKYPPLALQARVQGKVALQLGVRNATGEVYSVSATGHPLLTPSAVDAAKQWRFVPSSIRSDSLVVTLDFALRCR